MHLSCLLGTLLINVYEQSLTTTLADFTTSRPDSLLLAQSGLIKWIRDRIGLQQEEDVWASGLYERLVSERNIRS